MLTLFIIGFSYLSFSILAPWQLDKNHDINERNKQIERAYESDPQPVADVLGDGGAIRPGEEWTRVSLQGHYLPDSEVLLRLRPAGSGPSYQSLVVFETNGGQQLLVNRGWLPAGEANAVPDIPAAPAGEQEVTGMVRESERVHDSAPIEREGYQQVYSVNSEQIGELTSTRPGEDYVQLSEGSPGVLNPMPVPKLDSGNHLSYGLQWLAFGALAPAALIYFVYSEVRERKRVREEEAEMAGGAAPEPASVPAAPADSSTEPATEPGAESAGEPARAPQPDAAQKPKPEPKPKPKRASYGSAGNNANVRRRRGERF